MRPVDVFSSNLNSSYVFIRVVIDLRVLSNLKVAIDLKVMRPVGDSGPIGRALV